MAFLPKRPPAPGAHPRGGAGARPSGRQHRAGAGGDGAVIVVGQPLPFQGTCKHYRHSHRWLRFPCCGQRFPCDICHEERTDGHEMAWAKRMTCGYCSLEQAVAEKCAGCGKKVASSAANPAGRNTRFWEGGEGCRDPSSMSRKGESSGSCRGRAVVHLMADSLIGSLPSNPPRYSPSRSTSRQTPTATATARPRPSRPRASEWDPSPGADPLHRVFHPVTAAEPVTVALGGWALQSSVCLVASVGGRVVRIKDGGVKL